MQACGQAREWISAHVIGLSGLMFSLEFHQKLNSAETVKQFFEWSCSSIYVIGAASQFHDVSIEVVCRDYEATCWRDYGTKRNYVFVLVQVVAI